MRSLASHAAFLPPVPAPPHDPRSLRLDARAGWRAGDLGAVEIDPAGWLALEPLPGSGRQLAEPSGGFGGLRPPHGVAIDACGDVYSIDAKKGLLRRLDACSCRFEEVPCIGGVGAGPRQLQMPGGIGIARGNLFVADTDNHRLSVFLLRGLVLRGHWLPGDPLFAGWEPVDLAFDRRGRVYVGDRAHGAVHVFAPSGIWERAITGLGSLRFVAIDCGDRLYVVVQGDPWARVLTLDGVEIERQRRADRVADRFAPLPFEVTREGHLLIQGCGRYDALGQPAAPPPPSYDKVFPAAGRYLSAALDSRIYQCRWDRLWLRLRLPAGTGLRVRSYTSESEQPLSLIAQLSDDAWATHQTVRAGDGGPFEWDCLLTGPEGRYLWLAFDLSSSGTDAPRIEAAVVDFPRVSLSRYLPAVYQAEPTSADFTERFLAIFDRGFRRIEAAIDNQAHLFDPCSTPVGDARRGESDFLGWLASWIGVDFPGSFTIAKRRHYLKSVGKLLCMRGTRTGLRYHLLLFLGVDCLGESAEWQPPPLILEHFQTRRWLFLDAGRLGERSRLWGKRIANRTQLGENAQLDATQLETWHDPHRDPFHHHAHRFTAFLPARLACEEGWRRAVRKLIDLERPAHAQFDIQWVEPRMRVGIQSMIGYDAVIGRYPAADVVVNEASLGRATIVARSPGQGPTMRVGADARVGTTTKLG
jgi:phage tail-like protein